MFSEYDRNSHVDLRVHIDCAITVRSCDVLDMFVKVSVTVMVGSALSLSMFAEQAFEIMPGSNVCKVEGVANTEVERVACLFWMICEKSLVAAVTSMALSTASTTVAITAMLVDDLISIFIASKGVRSVETSVDSIVLVTISINSVTVTMVVTSTVTVLCEVALLCPR